MNKKKINSRSKKRKLSFEQKDNPLKKYDRQRYLMLRKIKLNDKNSKEISQEINDYFGLPEKYFQKNSPVTVGKKIILFDMNENRKRRGKKLKTEKNQGINLFNHLSAFAASFKGKTNSGILNNLMGINKSKAELNQKFEIINNERLKLLFDSYKKVDNNLNMDSSVEKSQSLTSDRRSFLYGSNFEYKTKLNEKKTINESNKNTEEKIPKDLKNGLNIQTKKLFLLKNSELKNKKFSKYLSKKANKSPDCLLLNRIDSFRYKKEMIKEIEYNKSTNEQLGRYKWNVSLRRPEHFRGKRETYVNLKGERFNPFWSLIIEKCPRQKNLCLKPDYVLSEGEINELKKKDNYLNQNSEKSNQYLKTLENIDDLIVKGKNLYNLEYKREIIDSKNNKILHKVFMENGKVISLAEVNKIYKNDIFYKDYNSSNNEQKEGKKF